MLEIEADNSDVVLPGTVSPDTKFKFTDNSGNIGIGKD